MTKQHAGRQASSLDSFPRHTLLMKAIRLGSIPSTVAEHIRSWHFENLGWLHPCWVGPETEVQFDGWISGDCVERRGRGGGESLYCCYYGTGYVQSKRGPVIRGMAS